MTWYRLFRTNRYKKFFLACPAAVININSSFEIWFLEYISTVVFFFTICCTRLMLTTRVPGLIRMCFNYTPNYTYIFYFHVFFSFP